MKIHTDLQLSGSVAQYGGGAGMIQDLASQIIGQFANNLSKQIEADQSAGEMLQQPLPKTVRRCLLVQQRHRPAGGRAAQVGGMAFKVLWNQIVRSIGGFRQEGLISSSPSALSSTKGGDSFSLNNLVSFRLKWKDEFNVPNSSIHRPR